MRVCLFVLVLIIGAGCNVSNSSTATTPKTNAEPAEAGPRITALEDDAAALRKLMGYHDVLAYEFAGTWLECWLECEVDGQVVASSQRIAVTPKSFGGEEIDFAESKNVVGWITVWGVEDELLEIKVRAELSRAADGRTYYAFTLPSELTIPPPPPQEDPAKRGRLFRSGTSLEAGWKRPVEIPAELGEAFTLQSSLWEERHEAEGPVIRQLRVSLKALRPEPSGSIAVD